MKLLVLAALAGVALATSAAAQTKYEHCVLTRDLRNHTVADSHTLYWDVGGRSVYRVTTSDSCLAGATSSDPVVLRDRGAMGRICTKMDLDISVRGARCIVASWTKLTPEEAAALPKHVKP